MSIIPNPLSGQTNPFQQPEAPQAPVDVAEYIARALMVPQPLPRPPVEIIREALQKLTVSRTDISAACPMFDLADGVRLPLFIGDPIMGDPDGTQEFRGMGIISQAAMRPDPGQFDSGYQITGQGQAPAQARVSRRG
jgi:hypothetical protein